MRRHTMPRLAAAAALVALVAGCQGSGSPDELTPDEVAEVEQELDAIHEENMAELEPEATRSPEAEAGGDAGATVDEQEQMYLDVLRSQVPDLDGADDELLEVGYHACELQEQLDSSAAVGRALQDEGYSDTEAFSFAPAAVMMLCPDLA